jgi:hypothetical protein
MVFTDFPEVATQSKFDDFPVINWKTAGKALANLPKGKGVSDTPMDFSPRAAYDIGKKLPDPPSQALSRITPKIVKETVKGLTGEEIKTPAEVGAFSVGMAFGGGEESASKNILAFIKQGLKSGKTEEEILSMLPKAAPKIQSAAMRIGGKLFEGANHNEALAKAAQEGVDISKINKETEGLFKLNNRKLITREQAGKMFGATHSEELEKLGVKAPPNESEAPKAPPPDFSQNKYVKDYKFDMKSLGNNDRNVARSLREQFSGIKNSQIIRGNQFADAIKRVVPNKLERQGMFWYKAANGNEEMIKQAIVDPAFKEYAPQLLKALDLSPQAKTAVGEASRYFDEAGAVSLKNGTIKNVRENYMNRIYKPEPPQDFIKTEAQQGLKQTTSHAKGRVFDTEFDAVKGGKKFATTDITETLPMHNEEMARVNASRKLADAMQDAKLGAWKVQAPEGWEKVGTLQKMGMYVDKEGKPGISSSSFYAPKGIAKGLEAIADPNFTKKIDTLRGLQRYQGLVKTVDLSYSFFHHFTMAAQTLYQGGLKTFTSAPMMMKMLKSPEFAELEQDFAMHTGMTTKIEENRDVMRKLVSDNKDIFSKISDAPVIKQMLQAAGISRDILFDNVQRYLKVSDYGEKIAGWVAKHPNATNEEVRAAKLGFAKEINNAYGGLNWEAMGVSKTHLSLLRLMVLAPDWTISNVNLAIGAFKGGTEGAMSRRHLATAIVGGMVLTEGLNKLITGHFTDENKKGHFLEVEVAPDVYVSFLRGGIGDVSKLVSMGIESGPLAGTARFAQGKLAPIPRTVAGVLTGTKYTGVPISNPKSGPIKKTYDYGKYIAQNAGPMPFGISNLMDLFSKSPETSAVGKVLVGVGLARYSKGQAEKPTDKLIKAIKSGKDEDIQKIMAKGELTQAQIRKAFTEANTPDAVRKIENLSYKNAYEQYKGASKEDKQLMFPVLMQKLQNKMKDPTKDQALEIDKIFKELLRGNETPAGTGEFDDFPVLK